MRNHVIALLIIVSPLAVRAGDLGFRYVNGKCVNNMGQSGFNKSYFGQCTDFSRLVAGRFDLSGLDLSGSQFSSASLEEVSFVGSTCIGCDFSAAHLKGVDFTNAVLQTCNFNDAEIMNSYLTEARITHSDFTGAKLDGLNLSYFSPLQCKFAGARFTGANLDFADLSGSNLEKVDFSESNLTHAVLNQVHAAGADFSNANLTNTVIENSDLRAARFRQAKLNQASMRNSILSGADLYKASMVRAQLDRVDLSNSNLQRSDLSQATFEGASFQSAQYNYSSVLPFSKSVASEQQMIYVDRPLVFLIWDQKDDELLNFLTAMEDTVEVVMPAADSSHFKGELLTRDMDVVWQITRLREAQNMEPMGQDSVASYVKAGGRYVYGPAIEQAFSQGGYRNMGDLILNKYRPGNSPTFILPNSNFQSNPLFAGVSSLFVLFGSVNAGAVRDEVADTVQIFASGLNSEPMITKRQVGKGYSLAIKFDCSRSTSCLGETNIVQLFKNAMTVAW